MYIMFGFPYKRLLFLFSPWFQEWENFFVGNYKENGIKTSECSDNRNTFLYFIYSVMML